MSCAGPWLLLLPVTVGDDIWVIGGQTVERRSNVLWRYDVRADHWHRQP